jgi:hypothetical protein
MLGDPFLGVGQRQVSKVVREVQSESRKSISRRAEAHHRARRLADLPSPERVQRCEVIRQA